MLARRLEVLPWLCTASFHTRSSGVSHTVQQCYGALLFIYATSCPAEHLGGCCVLEVDAYRMKI